MSAGRIGEVQEEGGLVIPVNPKPGQGMIDEVLELSETYQE